MSCHLQSKFATCLRAHQPEYFGVLLRSSRREAGTTFTKGAVNELAVQEVVQGYLIISGDNLQTAVDPGATPYIPFKSNTTGKSGSELWKKLFHYYSYKREEFLIHYHKRSNVETTFSMIKAKFGERLRSKTETAQINEALCKVLCHNLCVVIQSMYELGVAPEFTSEAA
jgi:hypothetical protein